MLGKARRITIQEVQQVDAAPGPDWNKIGPKQFHRSVEVELEHSARDPDNG